MCQLHDLPVIDEGISTHTLRRTYTAMMLAHGNPPKSVQEEAGHADERTTLRIYAQAINTDFKPTKRILTVLCAYTDEPHHHDPRCRQNLDGSRRRAPRLPRSPSRQASPSAQPRRAARQLHLNCNDRAPSPRVGEPPLAVCSFTEAGASFRSR